MKLVVNHCSEIIIILPSLTAAAVSVLLLLVMLLILLIELLPPSPPVAYPGIFFAGGSRNSVEDRGQRERGPGGSSPLVRGSAQFTIRFDFVKLSGCRGLLRMYFPRNCEFGPTLSKLRNFGGV
jgi:hypothetical protein